jgi:hypothetical protein
VADESVIVAGEFSTVRMLPNSTVDPAAGVPMVQLPGVANKPPPLTFHSFTWADKFALVDETTIIASKVDKILAVFTEIPLDLE